MLLLTLSFFILFIFADKAEKKKVIFELYKQGLHMPAQGSCLATYCSYGAQG